MKKSNKKAKLIIDRCNEMFNKNLFQDMKESIEFHKFKRQQIPAQLFKYRNLDYKRDNESIPQSILDFRDDILHFTKPRDFNDPYDSLILSKNSFIDFFTKEQLTEHLNKFLIKIIEESLESYSVFHHTIYDAIGELKGSPLKVIKRQIIENPNFDYNGLIQHIFRAVCFSEKLDPPLMWSHYTNSHQGFVLEYNFRGDMRVKRKFTSRWNLSSETGNRYYWSQPPERQLWKIFYTDEIFNSLEQFGKNVDHSDFRWIGILTNLYKASQWSYEKEWRWVDPRLNISGFKSSVDYLITPKPTALYLGSKMLDDENKKLLIEIAKEKEIPVYQMKLAHDKYQMIYDADNPVWKP